MAGRPPHCARAHNVNQADGRCARCKADAKMALRRVKRAAVSSYKLEKGCELCGYARSAAALHLHHRDPAAKEVKVSGAVAWAWDRLWAEVAKCSVICANCHAELHEDERSA